MSVAGRRCFVAPARLNDSAPVVTVDWPGLYWPPAPAGWVQSAPVVPIALVNAIETVRMMARGPEFHHFYNGEIEALGLVLEALPAAAVSAADDRIRRRDQANGARDRVREASIAHRDGDLSSADLAAALEKSAAELRALEAPALASVPCGFTDRSAERAAYRPVRRGPDPWISAADQIVGAFNGPAFDTARDPGDENAGPPALTVERIAALVQGLGPAYRKSIPLVEWLAGPACIHPFCGGGLTCGQCATPGGSSHGAR